MQYDILIIGGGIVGLTFAAQLSPSLNVAIIDSQDQPISWQPNNVSQRVSAINLQTQTIFQQINIWDDLYNMRVSPFRGVEVWDAKGNGKIHFNCFDIAEPHLGHIVENATMQQALLSQLNQVDFFYSTIPQDVLIDENKVELQLQNNKKITAKLIIGADGASSWLREQIKIPIHTRSYQQHAFTATVETEISHQQIARQVFLGDSILAFLPLINEKHCSIVWSCDFDKAETLASLSPQNFNTELTKAFNSKLGVVKRLDHLQKFPLTMRHAKNYVQHRAALIGDAAHTIHPLAGQGLNLGVMDATQLAVVINNAYEKHRDIGALDTLRRYERAQKGNNLLMLAAMQGFKQLFSLEKEMAVYLRNNGLNWVQRSNFLKNFFMRRAI